MYKSQSAMEYLMTYGWAILIIAVVLGALYSLGVFSGFATSPRAPPGSCHVSRPNGPLSTTYMGLVGVCSNQLPQYVASFSSSSSQYISLGNPSSLDPAKVTLAVWVRYPAGFGCSGNSPIFENMQTNSWAYGYYLYTACNTGKPVFFVGIGTDWSGSTGASSIYDGNWHFIAATYDQSNVVLYLDNQAPVTTSYAHTISYTNTNIYIDYSPQQGIFGGSVMVAAAQVYNASLSATEIQGLYLEGIGGAPQKLQNLVGWWPLNGNATDYSGDYNNGQAYNGVGYISSWTTWYTPP